jgi:hypothetical protein
MEKSFADAANNHHFKRARWRRLWRQQIQDYLIAASQNLRILLDYQKPHKRAASVLPQPGANSPQRPFGGLESLLRFFTGRRPSPWSSSFVILLT